MINYNVLLSIAITLGSFAVLANGQTCSGTYPYAPCSSNSACGCLPLSFTDDVGICAVLGMNCARLSPCRSSDHSCESPNQICVQHSQCDSRPLCYPLAMVDQRLCPPAMNPPTTTVMTTTTTTTFTTTEQPLITSYYSGSLNLTNQVFFRLNGSFNGTSSNFTSGYFFEAVQLVVYQSGYYNISSFSSMDTFGYLYAWDFSPFNISNNLLASDDDSGNGNQFSINSFLQAGYTYIVVVTTFQPNTTGPYGLHVQGPQYVQFVPRNITGVQLNDTTNTTQVHGVQSYLWSALSNSTDVLPGTYKHHNLIDLYISASGIYNITSVSNMDTYGCLFVGRADLSNGTSGAHVCDDDSAGNGQFRILTELQAGQSYTLLFTTYGDRQTGQYTLIVTGPDSVYMTVQSSVQNSTSTVAPPNLMNVWSSYSDVLTNSSPVYFRPSGNNTGSGYFFQAFALTVNQTGYYNLSSSGAIDTYGYLYEWNFSPLEPSLNLVNQDDDSAGGSQFGMTHWLRASITYVLVATTFAPGVTGWIPVSTRGPAQVGFTPLYSQSTNRTSTTYPTTTTQVSNMTSLYYGQLNANSTTFARPNNATSDNFTAGFHYYQTVPFSVNTTGDYVISSSSSVDTFGYLYQNRFDPSYTTVNLMLSDDDSAGERQFALRAHLRANTIYIVVVTTYNPREYGPYSLSFSGPSVAQFNA